MFSTTEISTQRDKQNRKDMCQKIRVATCKHNCRVILYKTSPIKYKSSSTCAIAVSQGKNHSNQVTVTNLATQYLEHILLI